MDGRGTGFDLNLTRVYDKGVVVNKNPDSIYQMLVSYRTGDMWAPRLDATGALRVETFHFVQCIGNGEHPITDGEAGLLVVRILEAATQSMAKRGEPIELAQ